LLPAVWPLLRSLHTVHPSGLDCTNVVG
jgi:hypothetical protein